MLRDALPDVVATLRRHRTADNAGANLPGCAMVT